MPERNAIWKRATISAIADKVAGAVAARWSRRLKMLLKRDLLANDVMRKDRGTDNDDGRATPAFDRLTSRALMRILETCRALGLIGGYEVFRSSWAAREESV